MNSPKILFIDIETAPLLGFCWGLWENNLAINQIKSDWHLLSFCAKWSDSKDVIYMDQRKEKNIEDDSKLLKAVWKLLDEADIVVGQNSKAFDTKKLNARFLINKMPPPSSYKQIDTMLLAKKHFSMTSNKLEYLSHKLCVKYQKRKVKEFPGFELWSECLKGNIAAFEEMRKYNIYDVLALEELYKLLIPWDNSINFNLYSRDNVTRCTCGSANFQKNGFFYSSAGKYQRYRCGDCGSEIRDKENLLPKEKRKSLKTGTSRG